MGGNQVYTEPAIDEAAESRLDHALERLHATDLMYDGEHGWGCLANHGPMVAEALVVLGQSRAIEPFLTGYLPMLSARPDGKPMLDAERASALGQPARRGDWIATFCCETQHGSIPELLARLLPPLLPGAMAASLHGLLRTAHAVRSLARRDNAVRRTELAFGLATWASQWQRLPGRLGAEPRGGWSLLQALEELTPVPAEQRRPGTISEAVRSLDDHARFAQEISSIDLAAAPTGLLVGQLTRRVAPWIAAVPGGRYAYSHIFTGTSAIRLLAPWLDDRLSQQLASAVFHCALAVHATYALVAVGGRRPWPRSPQELAVAAASTLDDHCIKLAEAALRENCLQSHPEGLLAAWSWVVQSQASEALCSVLDAPPADL